MEGTKVESYQAQPKTKEQAQFEYLYNSVYQDMFRFAYYTLRSVHDAEDVVSEAVVDAFGGFHTLKDEVKFKAWIFKILSRKCKRKLKEYTKGTLELEQAGALQDTENDYSGSAELKAAFEILSVEERLIVSMSVFGGYTSKDIAKTLRLNANTVRSKLSRSLEKMRNEIHEV